MFFASSNLTLGARVYPGSDTYFVNETATRSYSSGQRETEQVSFVAPSATWNVYFDKETGVMVELSETSMDGNGTFSLKLTDSSIWSVSTTATSPSISPSTFPSISQSTSPSTST